MDKDKKDIGKRILSLLGLLVILVVVYVVIANGLFILAAIMGEVI